MIRSIVVEDEMLSRLYLSSLLGTWCSHIEVVATAANCEDAVAAIDQWQPALVFLDIELLNSSGLDVLKRLDNYFPKIIFTTALDDHVLKIIRPSGLPFLQKPIDCDDLAAAITKLAVQHETLHLQQVQQLLQTLENANKPESIYVESMEGAGSFVQLNDIISIESVDGACQFNLINGTLPVNNHTLKDCEAFLQEHHFFRVSQRHLVNLFFAIAVRESEQPYMLLKNNTSLPVSPKKTAALKVLLAAG